MSLISSAWFGSRADALKIGTPFSWWSEIRELSHLQTPPAGWGSYAARIWGGVVLVIAVCIAGSWMIHGNWSHLFQERQLGTLTSVVTLVSCGVVCFRIYRRTRGMSVAKFWYAFGLLMCFLGADDYFRLHERADLFINHLMGWDPNNPITDHIDDVIVACYALPAIVLAFMHRKRLIQARFMVQILAVAFMLFGMTVICDFLHTNEAIEESLKLLAGATILNAFVSVLIDPNLPASWTGQAALVHSPTAPKQAA